MQIQSLIFLLITWGEFDQNSCGLLAWANKFKTTKQKLAAEEIYFNEV